MNIRFHALLTRAFLLAVFASPVLAQQSNSVPAIDPQADAILHSWADAAAHRTAAVIRIFDTIDEVQPDGSKLQFANLRTFSIQRPEWLKVETSGDEDARTIWMDGKTLTVLDRNSNVYAQLPMVGTIDQSIDLLQKKYNMGMPGADLLTGNLYATMTENCSAVDYIGVGYVGEEQYHHLAFIGGPIDWQLWLSVDAKPTLRKMVITYKQLHGEPQYTMNVLKVEEGIAFDESAFFPVLPAGAEKIEIRPVEPVQQKEDTP
ncbi:DUF2092 domain-containing protein [Pontiellaceae bacterium B1224]|nr:DUF2092 domain-containing protein [Pontiellaceae bacterium B1224]